MSDTLGTSYSGLIILITAYSIYRSVIHTPNMLLLGAIKIGDL